MAEIRTPNQAIGIGAATSALDAIFGIGSQFLMNQLQYNQQNALMDKSFENQLAFWNMQNAYNDPSSQIARLKQAGLNPAMLNGNAVNNQAANLSSVATPSAPNPNGVHTNSGAAMASLAQVLKLAHETELIDSQNAVFAQDLFNKILEGNLKKIAEATGLTEKEIKEMEREELYQFMYGEPSPGSKPLLNNRLTVARDVQIADANYKASISALNNALTTTENNLRDLRVATEKAQKAYYEAQANEAFASAQRAIAEGKAVTQETERRAYILGVGQFYGIDLLSLPPALQNDILLEYSRTEKYWQGLGKSAESVEHFNSSINRIQDLINRYVNRESAIMETHSDSYKLKFFGLGNDGAFSTTTNTNK